MNAALLVDHLGRPLTGKRYAAAKPSRLNDGWRPVERDINALISTSAPIIRGRVAQLVRDFPNFAAAVNRLASRTTGKGMAFQSRVKDAAGGLDRRLNRAIEDEFCFWADEAEINRQRHFYRLQTFAVRQQAELGEFLVVRGWDNDPTRRLPLYLQFFESAWLTSNGARGADGTALRDSMTIRDHSAVAGNLVHDGLEYVARTGRIVAYHLAEPGSSATPRRIPARDVAHGFDLLRAGQLRGVSAFAPCIMLAHDLSEYMNAELDAAQMAAKWLAFVTNGQGGTSGFSLPASYTDAGDYPTQKIEYVENAIIEYLRAGEDVKFASPNRPGDAFEPFTKFILRLVAVPLGVSYESISGDYRDVNYSTLKGIRSDEEEGFVIRRSDFSHLFNRRVHEWFLEAAVLTGRLSLPGFYEQRHRYLRADWMPPGMEPIEPLKEASADEKNLANRTDTLTAICRRKGRDVEDVLAELKHEKDLLQEYGLNAAAVAQKVAKPGAAGKEN